MLARHRTRLWLHAEPRCALSGPAGCAPGAGGGSHRCGVCSRRGVCPRCGGVQVRGCAGAGVCSRRGSRGASGMAIVHTVRGFAPSAGVIRGRFSPSLHSVWGFALRTGAGDADPADSAPTPGANHRTRCRPAPQPGRFRPHTGCKPPHQVQTCGRATRRTTGTTHAVAARSAHLLRGVYLSCPGASIVAPFLTPASPTQTSASESMPRRTPRPRLRMGRSSPRALHRQSRGPPEPPAGWETCVLETCPDRPSWRVAAYCVAKRTVSAVFLTSIRTVKSQYDTSRSLLRDQQRGAVRGGHGPES
jgi:hypothetical protein